MHAVLRAVLFDFVQQNAWKSFAVSNCVNFTAVNLYLGYVDVWRHKERNWEGAHYSSSQPRNRHNFSTVSTAMRSSIDTDFSCVLSHKCFITGRNLLKCACPNLQISLSGYNGKRETRNQLLVRCTIALLCVWVACRSVCCNWRDSRVLCDSFFDLSGSQQTPEFSVGADTMLKTSYWEGICRRVMGEGSEVGKRRTVDEQICK